MQRPAIRSERVPGIHSDELHQRHRVCASRPTAKLAEITTREQFDRLRKEWRDRFGKFPPAVDNLLLLSEIKLAAAKAGITRVEVREAQIDADPARGFYTCGWQIPSFSCEQNRTHLGEVLELIRKL